MTFCEPTIWVRREKEEREKFPSLTAGEFCSPKIQAEKELLGLNSLQVFPPSILVSFQVYFIYSISMGTGLNMFHLLEPLYSQKFSLILERKMGLSRKQAADTVRR